MSTPKNIFVLLNVLLIAHVLTSIWSVMSYDASLIRRHKPVEMMMINGVFAGVFAQEKIFACAVELAHSGYLPEGGTWWYTMIRKHRSSLTTHVEKSDCGLKTEYKSNLI